MTNSMLSDGDLEYIRESVEQLMPDRCYILTATETRNASGGVLQTWGTATTATACRFDPIRGTEQTAAGAVTAFYGYTVTIPHDTTVTAKNRIAWGGATFSILSVDSSKSWAGSLRLRVEVL